MRTTSKKKFLINDSALAKEAPDRAPSQKSVKEYVDNTAQGLHVLVPVKAATIANITLQAEQTFDAVSVVAGNRVLVKDQSTASENGIYLCVAGSNDWTRTEDFDEAGTSSGNKQNVRLGDFVFCEGGTANGGHGFVMTGASNFNSSGTAGSVNTHNIEFTQFSGLTETVAVNQGGTGATSLTDGGILLGSGTGAITALAVLTAGQIIIGDGTTDPAPFVLSGDVTMNSGGAVTIGNDKITSAKIAGATSVISSSLTHVLTTTGTSASSTVGWATLANVCFLEGTKITLRNKKQINIEDLTLDDKVLTYNIEGLSELKDKNKISQWQTEKMEGTLSESGIRNIWVNPTDSYLVINNKLRVTNHHLIHFKRDNKYYFNFAEQLHVGDELLTDDEKYEEVVSIEVIIDTINVYNFELDQDQTYFADNYLVHHYCKLCSGYANII